MARGFVYYDTVCQESFLSLGFVRWCLQAWELTEVNHESGRRFLKLQGKRSANPSWRWVFDVNRFQGWNCEVCAPCQLPLDLRHHGLLWEIKGDQPEPLAKFSAPPNYLQELLPVARWRTVFAALLLRTAACASVVALGLNSGL